MNCKINNFIKDKIQANECQLTLDNNNTDALIQAYSDHIIESKTHRINMDEQKKDNFNELYFDLE